MRIFHWPDIAPPPLACAAWWLTKLPIAASISACVPFQLAVAGGISLPAGVGASLASKWLASTTAYGAVMLRSSR